MDVVVQQPNRAEEMTHEGVVAGLADGLMKTMSDAERRARSSPPKGIPQDLQRPCRAAVDRHRWPLGGPFGGLPFQHAAEIEQILPKIRMGTQHLPPGIEKVASGDR